jgi:hypothetical protein
MTKLAYVEHEELFYYFYRYFLGGFSELHREVIRAVHIDSSKTRDVILAYHPDYRTTAHPEIARELADGISEFKRRASAAVMREHGGRITIPRCARCNAILRAPRARQCVWCGHSWFNAA